MKLKTGAWVVVVDGSHAIVFENEGTPVSPELKMLRTYDEHHPRTSELGEDAPPRAFSPAGGHRAAFEGADLHQVAEDRFVGEIVKDLEQSAAGKAFQDLVVVAPPEALGTFRKAAGPELSDRVILWIDKDLTKHPVAGITAAVTRALES